MSKILLRLLMDDSQFDSRIKKAKDATAKFRKRVELASASYNKFTSMLAKTSAFVGVSAALGDIVKTSMEFEKAMSSLSALTGATGEDLEFLRIQAINLGATTTQTASQVADAFKLIGSHLPELLKSKEALVAVTRSAIMLAEASESDVPTAAKALSGALNQMGAGAERAEEYVNILAAASQQGSADIDYLNKAVEKSGGTANATGVKFNELVAAIETIAPKVTEASEAGTQLRNIFLTLESSSEKDLKPSVVGLSGALETLAGKHYDAGEMAKLFGKVNVNAALALVSSIDTYKELETSITGTNTAQEQALTNTTNLAGSVTKLQSAWEGFTLSLNQSNGVLSKTVDFVTMLVNKSRELLISSEQLSAERVASGSSDMINESYAHIRSSIDKGGMSRKDAYDKEIKRLEGLLKPAEKSYNKTLFDFNHSWNEGLQSGRIKKGAYGKQYVEDTEDGSVLWASRDAAMRSYKNLNDLKNEYEVINSTIKALRGQANAVVTVDNDVVSGSGGLSGSGKKGKKVYKSGSIGSMEKELSDLQERLKSAVSEDERLMAQMGINRLTSDIESARYSGEYVKTSDELSKYRIGGGFATVGGGNAGSFYQLNKMNSKDIGEKDVWGPSKDELKTASEYMKKLNSESGMFENNLQNSLGMIAGNALQSGLNSMISQFVKGNNLLSQMLSSVISIGIRMGAMKLFSAMGSGGGGGLISGIFGGGFAGGGIVGGQSYNDGVVARLSSGEMVINQADQKRLLDTIKGGGSQGGVQTLRLDGETMYMAISNYGRRNGKGALKFER